MMTLRRRVTGSLGTPEDAERWFNQLQTDRRAAREANSAAQVGT